MRVWRDKFNAETLKLIYSGLMTGDTKKWGVTSPEELSDAGTIFKDIEIVNAYLIKYDYYLVS